MLASVPSAHTPKVYGTFWFKDLSWMLLSKGTNLCVIVYIYTHIHKNWFFPPKYECIHAYIHKPPTNSTLNESAIHIEQPGWARCLQKSPGPQLPVSATRLEQERPVALTSLFPMLMLLGFPHKYTVTGKHCIRDPPPHLKSSANRFTCNC